MIFVTIGSQEPFDRMIKCIDEIAGLITDHEVLAQVATGSYHPQHIKTVGFISPVEYNNYILKSSLVIAHAGMGTILSVLQTDKPLLIFPRLARFKETRNDHQVATARWFEQNDYLYTAFSESELKQKVLALIKENKGAKHRISESASAQLISSIRNQIHAVKSLGIKETSV